MCIYYCLVWQKPPICGTKRVCVYLCCYWSVFGCPSVCDMTKWTSCTQSKWTYECNNVEKLNKNAQDGDLFISLFFTKNKPWQRLLGIIHNNDRTCERFKYVFEGCDDHKLKCIQLCCTVSAAAEMSGCMDAGNWLNKQCHDHRRCFWSGSFDIVFLSWSTMCFASTTISEQNIDYQMFHCLK